MIFCLKQTNKTKQEGDKGRGEKVRIQKRDGESKEKSGGGRGKAGERRGEYQALPCVV